MSMMKTLAKVALGVAVAKGVSSMARGANRMGGTQQAGGGLQDILGSVLSGRSGNSTGGGLGGMLESLGNAGGAAGGGLTGMLGQLTGAAGGSSGGLGGMLGQLGGAAGAGGLGGLLGSLAGGGAQQASTQKSFGDLFNDALERGEPEVQPSAEQEAVAALLLSAMIQAAKSDGKLDEKEKEKIIGQLGDEVEPEEMEFVNNELSKPVDIKGLARAVPNGLEQQVYAVSLMAIDLDSQSEAQYLHELAQSMGINEQMANAIHDQLGVQKIYS